MLNSQQAESDLQEEYKMQPLPFQNKMTTVGNSVGFTVPMKQIRQGRILRDWEYEIILRPVRKIQKETPADDALQGKSSHVKRAPLTVLSFNDEGDLLCVTRNR